MKEEETRNYRYKIKKEDIAVLYIIETGGLRAFIEYVVLNWEGIYNEYFPMRNYIKIMTAVHSQLVIDGKKPLIGRVIELPPLTP